VTIEITGLAGADRHVIELAAGRTIIFRLHVSFLTSLFQHVGALVRKLRMGAIEAEPGHSAVALFAAACPPIEMLRWGEYAVRDAADLAGVQRCIESKAKSWSADLVAAMDALAEGYRQGDWPDARRKLLDTQAWLAAELAATKDDMVLGMRRGLMLADDDRPVDIVLVGRSYDIAGAHSHPALVDTSRFTGADLVETVFHEVGHELIERGRSGIDMLNRALAAAPTAQVIVFDLLHILLFAHVGGLVSRHFDGAHEPLLYRDGRLARLLQRMRVAAPQSDVIAILNRHAAGQVELGELVQFFVQHLAGPSRRPGIRLNERP
jgi:hypothetical protein